MRSILVLSVVGLFLLAACGRGGGGSKPRPPGVPQGINAWSTTSSQVIIDWGAVPGATSYDVYWSPNPGVSKSTGTRIVGATAPYVHTGLFNGITYFYAVTASNAVGEGAESAEVSALPLDPPTGVTALGRSTDATIDWNPGVGAAGYDLYWSTSPGVTPGTGNLVAGVSAPFLHTGLTNGSTYYYVLTALNAVGGGAVSIESAEVSAVLLDIPTGVFASGRSSAAVIGWSPVSGATSYNVYWSTSPGVTKATGNRITGVSTPHLHTALSNGTTYYYVVTAGVPSGEGAESAEVSAMPVAAPTGVTAAAATGEVTLAWSPVPGATSYILYWSTSTGVTRANGIPIPGATSPHVHTALVNGTTHYYVITAVNSVGGGAESTESPEVSATPLDIPTGIFATGRTGSALVGWSPVTGATTYNLYWATSPGVTKATGTVIPGVSTPFLHGGLADGTTHYYVVTAANASGESAESAEVFAMPLGLPTAVSASAATGEATVIWSPIGGATSYNIYWSTSPGVTIASGTRIQAVTSPHTHTALVNGTTYYYVVTGLNSVGSGAESAESAEASAMPLAAPTGVTASAASAQVTVSWSPVTGASSYDIHFSTSPGVTVGTGTLISGATSPHTHTALVDGTTYYYVVTGANGIGGGGRSAESAEVSAMPLAPPTGISAAAATGEVTVTWSPVAGAASYNLYWAPFPGVTKATGALIPGVTSPHLHAGLVDGTNYYYVVTALNSFGGGAESSESAEVSAMPLGLPAGVAASAGTGDVTVTWSPAAGATSYNLYWSTTPGVTKATGTQVPGVTSPHVQTGLASAVTYYYVVTATNGAWESVDSAEVSAMPMDVAGGMTVSGGSGDVTLDWSPVAGATSYNLYWSTSPGVTKATGTLVSGITAPHLLAGLVNGTTYYFVVTAVNTVGGGGESAESAEVFAMPMGSPLGVAAAGATGQVTVSWSPVAGATSYDLYWATSPGVTISTGAPVVGVNSPHSQGGLTNGTTHHFVVTAVNSIGGGTESAESSEVSAMPLDVPTGVLSTPAGTEITLDWNAVAGAAAYNIYWSTTAGVTKATGTLIAGVTPPHLHAGLVNGTTYYHVVAGVNAVGGGAESAISAEVSGIPASTGQPDTSFNGQGWLNLGGTSGGNGDDLGWSIDLDGTGRIIIGGSTSATGGVSDMTIWRVNDDGTLDLSFNGQGWTTHNIGSGGGGDDAGFGVAPDSTGRIVVSGFSSFPGGNLRDTTVWRYLDDASLDVAFNALGWVVDGSGKESVGEAVVLDAAGGLVVTGVLRLSGGTDDMAIWRYNPDGSPDLAFNGQGWLAHDSAAGGGKVDWGKDLVLDALGRILVTGFSLGLAGGDDVVIWRFNGDGSLDATFNGQGWVVHDSAALGGGADVGSAIAVDSSGRILVAGSSLNLSADEDMVVWRFNADGSLDTTFNGQGWLVHADAAGGGGADLGNGIALDGVGKILVTGSSTNASGNVDMALWRFNDDGSLDTTFNTQGWLVHDNAAGGGGRDSGEDLVLDSQGRIVITGSSADPAGNQNMVIWRYR